MKRLCRYTVLMLFLVTGSRAVNASVDLDDEEVVFRLKGRPAGKFFLVGDFNGWNPTIDRMAGREDVFEIRLFLLPGRYRYRFIVDGVSIPDPDNEHRGPAGHSFFILVERDGVFRIVFSEDACIAAAAASDEAALSGNVDMVIGPGGGALYGLARVDGSIEGGATAYMESGLEYRAPEGETWCGDGFLVKASARYGMERGAIEAFSRSVCLSSGDPLSIFGAVGPFEYPLGLFCRGIMYEGKPVFGIGTRLFYAGRINGYRTGLETEGRSVDSLSLFRDRDLTDSDLLGVRVGLNLGPASMRYLYRMDRRPRGEGWSHPAGGDGVFNGPETVRMHGVWVSFPREGKVRLDVQYLEGETHLSAETRVGPGETCGVPYEADMDWEDGYRVHFGLSYGTDITSARLLLERTTLEGRRALRDGRQSGEHSRIECSTDLRMEGMLLSVGVSAESFSSSNTGEVFWLQRNNFWLDGDHITPGHIPFLESSELIEFRLALGRENRNREKRPYEAGTHVSFLYRGDQTCGDRGLLELRFRKELSLVRSLSAHVDMRYVSFRHEAWKGDRDFVDVFAALSYAISGSSWVSVGIGARPYFFDVWRYRFSPWGREKYLIDEGLFDALGTDGVAGAIRALGDAENTLSEEVAITFETSYSF